MSRSLSGINLRINQPDKVPAIGRAPFYERLTANPLSFTKRTIL